MRLCILEPVFAFSSFSISVSSSNFATTAQHRSAKGLCPMRCFKLGSASTTPSSTLCFYSKIVQPLDCSVREHRYFQSPRQSTIAVLLRCHRHSTPCYHEHGPREVPRLRLAGSDRRCAWPERRVLPGTYDEIECAVEPYRETELIYRRAARGARSHRTALARSRAWQHPFVRPYYLATQCGVPWSRITMARNSPKAVLVSL